MHIPIATYRLQFDPALGFKEARAIAAYLSELGISDIYASPIFKSRKGSLHGYDIVDPTQLNPELGTSKDFELLMKELKNRKMGWLQDIVPNHMAYDGENQLLMNVLENGQGSQYYDCFDIDWNHFYESIRGRVLAPFLGGFYGECLENGEIKLSYDQTGLSISYYSLRFPLKIESYGKVFTHNLATLKGRLGSDHPDFTKFLGILYAVKNLPPREEVSELNDQVRFIKRMLWELYTTDREIKNFIDANVETFNGIKGSMASFHLLDSLLTEQNFRLTFWKFATEEINYRRFFNINELICLRTEDQNVFNHTHGLIFRLIDEGKFTGLRVDHVDGFYDPTGYLKRLRRRTGDTYLLVEKILALDEDLPNFWPVQGTTGYDFMNYVNGLFCKKKSEREFKKIYTRFSGLRTSYDDIVSDKKRLIIEKHMGGEVDNLAHLMKRISSRDIHGSDITLYGLKRAIVEILAFFPVYRSYINNEYFSETDRFYISEAIKKAEKRTPGFSYELSFIKRFLMLEFRDNLEEAEREQCLNFIMRFQQLTGPIMAKGFEDTTLYVYNRLLSLNEVGGNPNRFSTSLSEFHDFIRKRADLWPHSMNATSTHDTKRGEDVRARINVLSEIPQEWENCLKNLSNVNRRKKKIVNGLTVPERNDEYFLYQTLIGAFPFQERDYPAFIERLKGYVIKAVREAKIHTAWLKPDFDYENTYISFIERILRPLEKNKFLNAFLPFQKKVAHYGILNSLSQTLIKITAPGVPDFYQGSELWDLNLVDPDNRRPVDFARRMALQNKLNETAPGDIPKLISELLITKEDGRIKHFLTSRALQARTDRAELFQRGSYLPLDVEGKFKDNVIAYARNWKKSWAICIAPRLLTSLVKEEEYPLGIQIWGDTGVSVEQGTSDLWRDALTGESIKGGRILLIGDILKCFPVSLLLNE